MPSAPPQCKPHFVPVVLHLLQSLSVEQVLVLQVGLLVGFLERCISADLKERESVIAWEMGKQQGLRVLFLGRTKLSPLAVPECWCQGLCWDLCNCSKLRQLQASL